MGSCRQPRQTKFFRRIRGAATLSHLKLSKRFHRPPAELGHCAQDVKGLYGVLRDPNTLVLPCQYSEIRCPVIDQESFEVVLAGKCNASPPTPMRWRSLRPEPLRPFRND